MVSIWNAILGKMEATVEKFEIASKKFGQAPWQLMIKKILKIL